MQIRSAFVPHDLKAPLKGAASGPLAGLIAAVKDMYDIAGERAGGGNPDWLKHTAPAAKNADVIQKLLDAGATIIGKTICDEFFYSVTGANAHYGTPVNPRAPGRVPGGSSSGSASAAAAGACDFTLGSDTGGSVRVPAALCGIYGIRPTVGRVDLSGVMAMSPSFDVPGWFASGPGVFRKVGGVMLQGERVPANVQKVVVLDDAFAQADPEVAALLRAALDTMAGDLPKMTHATVAPDGLDPWREAIRIIQAREVWETFGEFVERHKPKIGSGVRERIEFAAKVSKQEADASRLVQVKARDHLRGMTPPGTVLALPSAPCIAPLTSAPAADQESYRVRVMRLTCIAGMGGLPQVSLPVGTVSGCPVGLSFIGWAGGDEALLDLAVSLSRHCGLAA